MDDSQRKAILDEAHAAQRIAGHLGRLLAEHASNQRGLQRFLRTVNFLVGVSVAALSLLAFIPQPGGAVNQRALLVGSLLAAALLVFDAALPSLSDEPNPDRFQDYSFYVEHYPADLMSVETDSTLHPDVWRARMRVCTAISPNKAVERMVDLPFAHRHRSPRALGRQG